MFLVLLSAVRLECNSLEISPLFRIYGVSLQGSTPIYGPVVQYDGLY